MILLLGLLGCPRNGVEPLPVHTALDIDLRAMEGRATIDFGPSSRRAAVLDVQGLEILRVSRPYRMENGRMYVNLARSTRTVDIGYRFEVNEEGGLLPGGSTFLWPDWCGYVFPCRVEPRVGATLDLRVSGAPAGSVVVAPTGYSLPAPSYMVAWAVGPYLHRELGRTPAGTGVHVWYLPGGEAEAIAGTDLLVGAVAWLEATLGPYAYGSEVGSVAAVWGEGQYGGMEHHPLWHVADSEFDNGLTHIHEAAHGWFGNGVRIACWEDFVLSEGVTAYLAARASEAVGGPEVGAEVWERYRSRLETAMLMGDRVAWPRGCGGVQPMDMVSEHPYMRGAFFLRDVARRVGVGALDEILAAFYRKNLGTAASMQDLIIAIEEATGEDLGGLVEAWLRTEGVPASAP